MGLFVITATLGTSSYLVDALASADVLGSDIVHVVVAPNDISRKLVNGKVLIEDTDRAGLYCALNRGIAMARGDDYLVFLNDDDSLLPEMAKMVAYVMENGIDFAIGDTCLIDEKSKPISKSPSWPMIAGIFSLCRGGIVPFYQVATVVRCSVLREAGTFRTDLRLAADLDLYMKILNRKVSTYRHRKPVACFRVGTHQLSADVGRQRLETSEVLGQFTPVSPILSVFLRIMFRVYNSPIYIRRLIWR